MANSVDRDQTAPIGAVCSGSTLFASILNLSVMLGNYLQQTTSADNIFRCILLGVLRVNAWYFITDSTSYGKYFFLSVQLVQRYLIVQLALKKGLDFSMELG